MGGRALGGWEHWGGGMHEGWVGALGGGMHEGWVGALGGWDA